MPRVNDLRRDQRLAVDLFQEVVHQGLVGAKDSCGDSMARQFGPHGTALGQAFEEPDFHRGAPTSLGAQFPHQARSEEHTSELQSLMRISYAVFCLKKKKNTDTHTGSYDRLAKTTVENHIIN